MRAIVLPDEELWLEWLVLESWWSSDCGAEGSLDLEEREERGEGVRVRTLGDGRSNVDAMLGTGEPRYTEGPEDLGE